MRWLVLSLLLVSCSDTGGLIILEHDADPDACLVSDDKDAMGCVEIEDAGTDSAVMLDSGK